MADGMKIYQLQDGRQAWYWPGDEPAGAVEVKAAKPEAKAKAPANKARNTATK